MPAATRAMQALLRQAAEYVDRLVLSTGMNSIGTDIPSLTEDLYRVWL